MKHKVFPLLMFAGMLTAFSACNRDDVDTGGNGDGSGVVVINSGISSKAVDAQWETGDAIGVTVYDATNQTMDYTQFNHEYVTNQTLGVFNAASSDQLIYFPQDGSNFTLNAYYPYKGTIRQDMLYAVDVQDQNDLPGIDLMTAEHTSGFSKNDQQVNLRFYHRLSKLIFNISLEEGGDYVSLLNTDMTITGAEKGNTYDLHNDVFIEASLGEGTIAVPYRGGQPEGYREAIVLPREAGEGYEFHFTAPNGNSYYAIMSDTLNLEGGNKYIFNIVLSRNPVVVSAEIVPWIENDPQYYQTITLSTPGGVSEGFSQGDRLSLYLQNTEATAFDYLTAFTFQAPNEWEPDQVIYWEDIEPDPATFRASVVLAEPLNDTQMADILIADDETVARNGGIHLTMRHAGSKVTVQLESGTFAEEKIRNAIVTFPDYQTGGEAQDGSFVPGTGQGNILLDKNNSEVGVAIIQPQTIAPSVPIMTVTIDGRDYNVRSTRGMLYEPGVAYLLIVNAHETDFTISASVVDWDEETFYLDAVNFSSPADPSEGVLDGEVLYVYTGDILNRALLGEFTYEAASQSFSGNRVIYWEELADPTTFYSYIRRAPAYNSTQLDDFLVAQPIEVAANNPVNFTLSHAAAQVMVQLQSTDGSFSDAELAAMTLTLPGYVTGGEMNSGLFVPGNIIDNVAVAKGVGTDGNSAIALIQPQTITTGTPVIEIASTDRTYRATYATDIVYTGGMTTILVVDMAKTEVELSARVVDWVDKETIPLVAESIQITGNLGTTDNFFNGKTIYVYKMNDLSQSYPYAYDGTEWSGSTIYWNDEITPLNLSAVYSPKGEPTLAGTSFPWNITANQSAGYTSEDLLTSTVSLNSPSYANFEFTHALSQLKVLLIPGEGMTLSDLQNATIVLNGYRLNGSADLATGAVTATTATADVTPQTITNGQQYEAIVMPQTKNQGDTVITLTLTGYPNAPFAGTVNRTIQFEAGKTTTITVTVNKTELLLSANLADWAPGDVGGVVIQ